jgi:SH3 domain-containing YSC84-like protein 1
LSLGECRKAAKILTSFIDPKQAFGPDKVIPPDVLAGAKVSDKWGTCNGSVCLTCLLQGLAVLTVLKAGFLGSGRFGSGIVVARLSGSSWSAPSAIATAGAGFGGQIGFELTDFVFILNDAAAVRTFSQAGTLTLGGNVSIAAGPVGRNAEAAGAASTKGVAAVFSYSKTKGLFAGVSLEGSVLVERRDANEKLYHRRVTASELLSGSVRPPDEAEPLMQILKSRSFAGFPSGRGGSMYNDTPVYDDRHDDVVWEGRKGSAFGEGTRRDRTGSLHDDLDRPRRTTTWSDDVYDRPATGGLNRSTSRANPNETFDSRRGRLNTAPRLESNYVYSDKKPSRPTAPKPVFGQRTGNAAALRQDQAVALYTFEADQEGDLGFKKGDIITILKKTDKKEDWWTGRVGDRTGIFPRYGPSQTASLLLHMRHHLRHFN